MKQIKTKNEKKKKILLNSLHWKPFKPMQWLKIQFLWLKLKQNEKN